MGTRWLARRAGLDRNPLRRRAGNIAARLTILLLAVFLIGWEAEWAAVGPRWTRRFRSRGTP